jgi:hypothetical protein
MFCLSKIHLVLQLTVGVCNLSIEISILLIQTSLGTATHSWSLQFIYRDLYFADPNFTWYCNSQLEFAIYLSRFLFGPSLNPKWVIQQAFFRPGVCNFSIELRLMTQLTDGVCNLSIEISIWAFPKPKMGYTASVF